MTSQTESKADDNGWVLDLREEDLHSSTWHIKIFIGGLFGEVELYDTTHPMSRTFDNNSKGFDKYFMDWLHPTEEERTLFILEGGFVLPTDETLSKIKRRVNLYS